MRIENVPVDMSSEQKEFLGIVSKRQLGYLIVGGLIIYGYAPFVFKIFNGLGVGWLISAIITMIAASPIIVVVLLLGFVKVEKFNMNRDFYYWIWLQKRTQYGSWRKGRD